MPHYLHEYLDFRNGLCVRARFAVVDDYGNLTPCHRRTWVFLFPNVQIKQD